MHPQLDLPMTYKVNPSDTIVIGKSSDGGVLWFPLAVSGGQYIKPTLEAMTSHRSHWQHASSGTKLALDTISVHVFVTSPFPTSNDVVYVVYRFASKPAWTHELLRS